MSINFYNALQDMEKNSFANIIYQLRNNTNPIQSFLFNNITKLSHNFHTDMLRDAKLFTFLTKEKYIKLSLQSMISNFDTIIKPSELIDRYNYLLSVFINGKKVLTDDVIVKLYKNNSMDIFIPSRLLGNDKNTIYIKLDKFDKLTKTIKYLSIKNNIRKIINFVSEKNTIMYIDGILKEFEKDNNGNIILENDDLNKNLEIFTFFNVAYSEYIEANDSEFIYLPNEIQVNLPLLLTQFEIYQNGILTTNDSIERVSSRIFKFKPEFFIKGSSRKILFFSEMDKLTNLEYNDDTIDYFKFDKDGYKDVLDDNKKEFIKHTLSEYYSPVKDYNYSLNYDNKYKFISNSIEGYIKNNMTNFRYLLKNFNKNISFRFKNKLNDIRYDNMNELKGDSFIKFPNPKILITYNKPAYDNFIPIISVNNRKVLDDQIDSFIVDGKVFAYIDADYVTSNDDEIIITIFPFNFKKVNYKKIILDSSLRFRVTNEELNNFSTIDDLFIFKKNGDGTIFITDYEFNNNEFYLPSCMENDTIILYNRNFFERRTIIIKDELEQCIVNFDEYDKDLGCYLPKHTNNAHILLVDGELMLMDIDYSMINQTINGVEYGMILWNKMPKLNSVVEIYHFGYNFPLIKTMEYIPNKYGIIKLDNILYPFDNRYTAVFVDSIRLSEDQVIRISDRFIKIRNIKKNKNLVIMPSITENITNFLQYIQLFLMNQSLLDKYLSDLYDESITNIEEFYLKDKIDRVAEEIPMPDFDDRISPLTSYISLLFKNGNFTRYLNANEDITYLFNKYPVFKYFIIELNKIKNIILDCNKDLNTLLQIDPNTTMYTKDQIIKIATDLLFDNTDISCIDSNIDVEELVKDTELNNYLYPEEYKQIDMNEIIENEIIKVYDANQD